MRPIRFSASVTALTVFTLLATLCFSSSAAAHNKFLTKRDYVRRMGDQLADATSRLRRLDDRGLTLPAGERAGFKLSMRKLWQKERRVRILLEKIKRSKGDEWLELKKTEDTELISLNKFYHNVVGRYLHERA